MARRAAGHAGPVDGDVTVDAEPGNATVGKDVQPDMRPGPNVGDWQEVVAVRRGAATSCTSVTHGAPSAAHTSGVGGRALSSASSEQCDG